MAEVYWIHLPSQTDVFSEGYVGFTSRTASERFKEHQQEAKIKRRNIVVYNAINKYGAEIICETLCICDDEYGLWLENKLRPEAYIGWNMGAGGKSTRLGTKATDETKRKLSAASKGRKNSLEANIKQSITKTGRKLSPEHLEKTLKTLAKLHAQPKTDEWRRKKSAGQMYWRRGVRNDIWLVADALYVVWENRPSHGLGTAFRKVFPPYTDTSFQAILRAFKAGWNPNEDLEWIEWKEKQILKERIANES